MSMRNVNGFSNENGVQQHFLNRTLGAPLLLITYKNEGQYFGRPSKDRVQCKPMAVGLKNSGMTDVVVWELKKPESGAAHYVYAQDIMTEIFGKKKNAGENSAGLSKAELQQRGLALESFSSDVHTVKLGKTYDEETYIALLESFNECWREIGGAPQLSNMIDDFIQNWDDMTGVETEEAEEEETEEVEA